MAWQRFPRDEVEQSNSSTVPFWLLAGLATALLLVAFGVVYVNATLRRASEPSSLPPAYIPAVVTASAAAAATASGQR